MGSIRSFDMDRGLFFVDDNDDLKIAKEFFNTFSGSNFYDAVSYLCQGVGYGNEYSACEFPDDLDFDEEAFEGARFRYFDDELIVSFKQLELLIDEAVEKFVKMHPDQKERIEKLIDHGPNLSS